MALSRRPIHPPNCVTWARPRIQKESGKWGYIDNAGTFVIPAQFDRAQPFSEGLAAVESGGKWGYIDKTGTFVIPPQFEWAPSLNQRAFRSFSDGLAAVKTGDKYGYIDRTGTFAIPAQFEFGSDFQEGLARVVTGRKYGWIDKTGTLVIPPQFDFAYDFEGGIACVQTGRKYGWIDKTGNFVIPAQFDKVALSPRFHEGLAVVGISSGDRPSTIADGTGVDLATGKVKSVTFGVRVDSPYLENVDAPLKYGYIDRRGQKVIECRFDDAEGFQEGIASVKIGGKWGGIDKTGKLVIPSDFDEAFWFSDGLAWVTIGGKSACIDKTGQSKVGDVYTVNPADTLFHISVRVYGDGSKWKAILDANPELRGEPGNIRVGMKLKIPRGSGDAILNSGSGDAILNSRPR